MAADPAALFELLQRLLNAQEWSRVAEICHPASVLEFRRDVIRALEPMDVDTDSLIEVLPEMDMPREVAAWSADWMRRVFDPETRLRKEWPGVASIQELVAMDPDQLFARWLAQRAPSLHEAACRRNNGSGEPATLAWNYLLAGVVYSSETVAHVYYRSAAGAYSAKDLEAHITAAGLTREESELCRQLWGQNLFDMTCVATTSGEWLALANDPVFRSGEIASTSDPMP